MPDHNENALQAAVKALTQVVAPAVDRSNPLALEQLRLVSMYLEFQAQQRPQERRQAWTDLRLQCDLCRAALPLLEREQPELCLRLAGALERAEAQLRTPVASTAAWDRTHGELAQLLSEAISVLNASGGDGRDALEALVIARAERQLALHRVWFASYGFEAQPENLPTLQDVLAGAPDI